MTDIDQQVEARPLVQCILCMRDYERKDAEKYRPLGAFVNYCLCEDCLKKDKAGWPRHK